MSWTDYDENSWEYQAGKALVTMKCDGPFKAIKASFEELFEADHFDAIARKAMAVIPDWGVDQQVSLLAAKQHDYGHNNIDKFGPLGVRVRLWDKIARLGNLGLRSDTAKNESYNDTLVDIVGYCTIYAMVKNGTFSFPLSTDMA